MKQIRKVPAPRRRKVQIAGWVHPTVKLELERIAKAEHLSSSQLVAVFVEQGLRMKLHEQNETLLYPAIRQAVHEELIAFGNRIVFFLMRIAFSAEQSRILITNVLDRVLRLLVRKPEDLEKIRTSLVDHSNLAARRNIIQKTPQLQSLLEEWEASFGDGKQEKKKQYD